MFPSIKVTSVQTKFFPRVDFSECFFLHVYAMATILKNRTTVYFQNALFIAFLLWLYKAMICDARTDPVLPK